MALFDKLKGAAEKAKEAAVKAVGAAAEMAEQAKKRAEQEQQAALQAEADTKLQQKEALKEQILKEYTSEDWEKYKKIATKEEVEELDKIVQAKWAAEKRENLEKTLKELAETSDCDIGKGDCFWHNETFFCTCGDDVDCPRKKYVKARQYGKVHASEHWPYLKLASTAMNYSFLDDMVYYKCRNDIKFNYMLDDFCEKFLPNCQCCDDESVKYAKGYKLGEDLEYLCKHGLGKDNPLMDILYTVSEKANGQVKVSLPKLVRFEDYYGVDMRQEFFKNPSLYDRDYEEFCYTAFHLDVASNSEKASQYFKNPGRVNVEELYNSDGTIKAAGIGGPKNGHYGDVIYNIIESWNEPDEPEEEPCDLNAAILREMGIE